MKSNCAPVGIYLLEDGFYGHVFYGDKDVVRLAHLMMGVPFYLQPHIPASAVLKSRDNYRDSLVHFLTNDSLPFAFHQLKSRSPDAFRHVYRLKEPLKSEHSVCSLHSHVVNSSYYEIMTLQNSNYNADEAVRFVSRIFQEAASYFSTNHTYR